MATNYRQDGFITDANLIVETGTTITAGSMIWVDISGTNVVHPIRSYSGVTPETNGFAAQTGRGIVSIDGTPALQTGIFLGVIANTQTGVGNMSGGNQTGVAYYTKGVFKFLTTITASCKYVVGMPVYPVYHDTVRTAITGINATPTNSTGVNPIGMITFLPDSVAGVTETGVGTVRVHVKLFPDRSMQAFA